MNLYLTGYRCTGKTTIGKLFAEKHGLNFIDADHALTDHFRMSVADIVEKWGWEDFRNKETEILKKLSQLDDYVIATGGGVILREENVDIMKGTGKIVWLTASVPAIASRISLDSATESQRPDLTNKGVINEIEDVLAKRLHLYQNSADVQFDSEKLDPEKLCNSISMYLEKQKIKF